jgi:hypothetical protein
MTRNQKIALGCGGAGCLGLIVVVIAGCMLYFLMGPRLWSTANRNADIEFESTRNTNLNSNDNENANENDNSSSSSSTGADSSLSTDERHRLFQAAAITGDLELQRRVWIKIGIVDEDFSQGDKYYEFATEHGPWVVRNYQWVATMDTAEKGRAYVNENLP